MKFIKEMYPKEALIKAAYNYTDRYYVHLESDEQYFYVAFERKDNETPDVCEKEFINEMLTQCVRHIVYEQTKNIREMIWARTVASSVVLDTDIGAEDDNAHLYSEDEILKDWFAGNDN